MGRRAKKAPVRYVSGQVQLIDVECLSLLPCVLCYSLFGAHAETAG
jgi:hypothetical protein